MKKKGGVITFKVDSSLAEAMRGIPNRSEFIRAAILSNLNNICPLCKGAGILTPDQKKHWSVFEVDHSVEECTDCHELKIVCSHIIDPKENLSGDSYKPFSNDKQKNRSVRNEK
jgi:hypothetical protein